MSRVLFTLLFVFAAFSLGEIWKDCSSSAAHFKIKEVKIEPVPPKIGKTVTVDVTGVLNEQVTGGKANFTVQYKMGGTWISLPTFNFDICTLAACPITSGDQAFHGEVAVPGITPAGEYRGKLFVVNQSAQEVACVSYETRMQ